MDSQSSSAEAAPRSLRTLLLALLGALVLAGAALWLAVGSRDAAAPGCWRACRGVDGDATARAACSAARSARSASRCAAGARTIVLDKLAWQEAHWAWRPHDGAWFGLVIDGCERRPRADRRGDIDVDWPVEPKTLRLPFALTIGELRIGELQYEAASPLRDIAARVELGHDAGREHRVPSLALRTDRASASGSARIAADAPFALDAQVQAASIDGAPRPWQASANAAGPLAAIAVNAATQQPASRRRAARRAGHRLALRHLAAVAAAGQHAQRSTFPRCSPTRRKRRSRGDARIDTQGLDKPITASVKLSNAQPGRWDEKRLPLAELELDLLGRADQRDRLTLRRFELRAPGDGGRASGQGEWKGGTATLDVTLQALRPQSARQPRAGDDAVGHARQPLARPALARRHGAARQHAATAKPARARRQARQAAQRQRAASTAHCKRNARPTAGVSS